MTEIISNDDADNSGDLKDQEASGIGGTGASREDRETESMLERAAADLHHHHKIVAPSSDPVPAWQHIDKAAPWLRQVRKICAHAPMGAGKAAEWILDNDYQVFRAIRQIKRDLPPAFYKRLPALDTVGDAVGLAVSPALDPAVRLGSPERRYPRVFALAHGLLHATHLQITLSTTIKFICAYQRKTPLTIAELWAFPAMLRIACLEVLVSSVSAVLQGQIPDPFAPTAEANAPYSLDDTERVARSIANLSLIASISWKDFFDQTSEVERVLSKDPANFYARMDFETRDRYRKTVETIGSYADRSEVEIAEHIVMCAAAADARQGMDHVGYWLIGNGRKSFEQQLGIRPPLELRLKRAANDHAGPIYALAALCCWIGALIIPALYLWWIQATILQTAASLLVMLIPASILSISFVQRLVTLIVPPRTLPKLDFVKGLPADCATMVVIPALIAKPAEIQSLVQQMEAHWLSNDDDRLQVGLLADLADGPTKDMPGDKDIGIELIESIRSLNKKHSKNRTKPFHLFMRTRRRNDAEKCWMAWERKRGKLEQFNRLLVEGDDSGFSVHEGNRSALSAIRFVITVDVDTILPTGSVKKLVGTLAHPLNIARFDPETDQITTGYSILQPRVEMTPQGISRTFFTRFFAGDTAIDIYSRAVSNVYQDIFGRGIFVGKGIYDVAAFHRSTAGRIAENSILSHDLLEGSLGRAGLVSDIILYEGFPGTYQEYVKRWHRWVRGDWQLLPWLGRRVRGADGEKRRNTLSTLSRWLIIDNLRRSVVAPSLLLIVIVGWLWLPGNPWFWTFLTVFAHGGNIFTDLVTGLARGRRRGAVQGRFAQLADQSGRWFLAIAHLPFEAMIALHAISVALWRRLVSKSHLLQWTTAAHESARLRNRHSRVQIWMQMWTGPSISIALGLAIQIMSPASLPAALPLLILWFIAPEITILLNRPRHKAAEPLSDKDKLFLRGLARRTWLYFETFAGPQDNWLPPDNYQGEPHPEIAHRTSPTNIGMMMLSTASAWDFGYLGAEELAARTSNAFSSLDRLERYRGHFLNWYDTEDLQPLEPRYVSVVDSGNFAGCLIAQTTLLREIQNAAVIEPQRWSGIDDILRLLTAGFEGMPEDFDGLQPRVASLRSKSTVLSADPPGWHSGLNLLCTEEVSAIEQGIVELATSQDSLSTASLRELHIWLDRLRHQIQTMRQDIEKYAPWLALDEAPSKFQDLYQQVVILLDGRIDETRIQRAVQLIQAAQAKGQQEDRWLETLLQAVESGRKNRERLARRLQKLSLKSEAYANDMEFAPFYDRERRLFHIGYNVSADRMDSHHYDLLASEARLASYWAIANQDVPMEHWFHLGRSIMRSKTGLALISWNGSMFEYLMPRLLMRSGPQTLLSESEKVAVEVQRAYGKQNGVPWGISESAYSARDPNHRYQYQAFGVPGLGLRRGLGKDLVIAPYASALALQVMPTEAVKNLKVLVKQGFSGLYGLLESVDLTPERLENPAEAAPTNANAVNAYMAHHQGMIMCAIGNSLCDDILVRRFEEDARIGSVSLLLHERIPQELPSEVERIESVEQTDLTARTAARPHTWSPALQTSSPQSLLLGNGSLSSWISTGGGGGMRWRNHALTRFLPDPVLDADGQWIYLYDEDDDHLWSATRQPADDMPDQYEVTFHSHMAEFHRRDNDISLRLETVVAAGDDLEIRRVTIRNLGDRPRSLRMTSYAEVVLAPPLDYERHPAFSKLFVNSEYVSEIDGQLFTRRPRNPRDAPPVLLHFVVSEDEALTLVGHEADRRRFIGRNGNLRRPYGACHELSGTTGCILDPIMALQVQCELKPFEHIEFCFVTVAAATREAALEVAERYATLPSLDWAIDDAASSAAQEVDQLGIAADQSPVMQALGSLLLYPNSNCRGDAEKVRNNRLGQPSLWGMAISGDYPILMLKTGQLPDPMLQDLIRAHQLWRGQGLEVDLVIMQTAASGYIEPMRDDLMSMLQEVNGQWLVGRNGGIHLLFVDQVGPEQARLVEAVSRVVIDVERGSLAEQVAAAFRKIPTLPGFEPTIAPVEETGIPELSRPDNLLFDNGLGGFTPDGKEYVIHLEPGQTTPAPWANILANDGFGCAVTETGGGFTWAVNSGENRLTAWTNDPVMDDPSEILYLRDEETAEIWTPTLAPSGQEADCQIRHGAGYSEWRKISFGLEQDLRIFVPVDDPVKIIRLRLTNHTQRHRRITATYYVDWLLGALRSISRSTVSCSYDPDHHAIMARNSWNPDFSSRAAFLTASLPPHGLTTDRAEFLGREGNLENPAGLGRWGLGGPAPEGTDPCGAYQVHFELEPGASQEVVFLLGQGENEDHARSLATVWKEPSRIETAFDRLGDYWDDLLGAIEVQSPDPAFDIMINRWLLYQSMASRIMARAGFYQASGAIGFRDQLQDVMAFLHNDPARARAHILDCAAHQFEEGDVLHWWHPPSDRGVRTRFSDDLLWLPYAVCHYVEVTGDESILQEEIAYLQAPPLGRDEEDRYSSFDKTADGHSLLDHCERALERGFTHGHHNLPLIGAGDWNDGMDRIGDQGRGESVWLAWFVITIAKSFSALNQRIGQPRMASAWSQRAQDLLENVEQEGWDGDWYRRAYDDDGHPWGSSENMECRIDSISQSWALFAGANAARTKGALDAAYRELIDEDHKIARLLWPPFDKTPRDPGYIKAYPPGIRENGGQYSHAATWLGMAFAQLGDAEKAMNIFNMLNPVKRVPDREQAERYRTEPYVVAADIAAGDMHGGRGGWTWYTGAAAWTWRLGVEEIMGIKRNDGYLRINPCLPDHWPGFSATIQGVDGSISLIVTRAKDGVDTSQIIVDGVAQPGSIVAFPTDGSELNVEVRIA